MRTRALTRTLVVLLMLLTGCAVDERDRTLLVLGPWLDDPASDRDESDPFRAVLERYGEEHDITITYRGTRAIAQAVRSAVQNGAPPDVVIMPDVGELARYARAGLSQRLRVPGGTTAPRPADELSIDHRVLWRRGGVYAVAIKTDLKSAVWHRPAALGGAPPSTWDEFAALTGRLPLCLGMSATSAPGWPGTDWVEDILLHQAGPDAYERWAAGTLGWSSGPVADAWNRWAALLRAGDDPRRALLTGFGEAGDALVRGECGLYHQGSFVVGTFAGTGHTFFPLPADPGAGGGIEVGADFGAALTDDAEAAALLAFLSGPAGQERWVAESRGAVFTPGVAPDTPGYDAAGREVATALSAAGRRCLDASDAMPDALATAFRQAILEQVADPGRDPAPLLAALDRLSATVAPDRVPVLCTS